MHIDFHSASGARAGKLYSFLAKAYWISNACLWRKADVSRRKDVRQSAGQQRTSALFALGRYTDALARK
jgi:hypothetical protein